MDRTMAGKISEHLAAKYGEPGSPIPDSRMFRWYCAGCGGPIRVRKVPANPRESQLCQCEMCSGEQKRLMPGGYGGRIDEDSGGYGANARMAMEGD